MRPANERRHYIVTSSLIGWVHTQNDPWGAVYASACVCVVNTNGIVWLDLINFLPLNLPNMHGAADNTIPVDGLI